MLNVYYCNYSRCTSYFFAFTKHLKEIIRISGMIGIAKCLKSVQKICQQEIKIHGRKCNK
jgi:hypothetical protein